MQCCANDDGFIGDMHKNNVQNLVVLCKTCHINVHQGTLTIKGWIQRDNGMCLDYN